MDAYTLSYITQGISDQLEKLYCLNLTKQQEREYRTQQKKFHIPFDVSNLTKSNREFLICLILNTQN